MKPGPVARSIRELKRWIEAPRRLVEELYGEPVQPLDGLEFKRRRQLIARYLVFSVHREDVTLVRMDGATWGEA